MRRCCPASGVEAGPLHSSPASACRRVRHQTRMPPRHDARQTCSAAVLVDQRFPISILCTSHFKSSYQASRPLARLVHNHGGCIQIASNSDSCQSSGPALIGRKAEVILTALLQRGCSKRSPSHHRRSTTARRDSYGIVNHSRPDIESMFPVRRLGGQISSLEALEDVHGHTPS